MKQKQAERGGNPVVLVIDVQNAVVEESWNTDAVVGNIRQVIDQARADGLPVVFVRHEEVGSEYMGAGTEGWQIHSDLTPQPSEPIVDKRYSDAFADTTMDETLERLGAGKLIVTGMQTDACVRATTFRALAEGYDVVLLSDCHTTGSWEAEGMAFPAEQTIAHFNLSMPGAGLPNASIKVQTSDEFLAAQGVGEVASATA